VLSAADYRLLILCFVVFCLLNHHCFGLLFLFFFRIITIHIHYRNYVTGEHLYSKLSLVDLPASECLLEEDASRDNVTDFLHVSKSLSA
jgi:hypothetical protein